MSLPPEKTRLGEQLYPLVQSIDKKQAGKITGMLLEMDNGEIRSLINVPSQLKAKVKEAQEVLVEFHASHGHAPNK